MIQAETLDLLEWQRLCQHLATFASTKLGVVAAQHLQIPTTPDDSLQLLAQTQEVYRLETDLNNSLCFDGIYDIGESLERAQLQGILSGEELLQVATTLGGARQLRRNLDAQPDIPELAALVAQLRTYPEIEQEIHRCIDDRGDVAERADPELGSIRQQLKQVRDRIYQTLQQLMQRHPTAVQELLISQRGDRFVIPVKASHKDLIRGIVHDTSTSGMTLYVEPQAIVEPNNRLRQLQRRQQAIEETVRRILTEQIAVAQDDLERLLYILTTLDLATARARYSLWLEANPPRFIPPGVESIRLRQLRHPLLVWQQKHEQGIAVVPINVNINPSIRVVTLTGPNTGGKTATLKTLALAMLMAKVGLFVPAREPVELPWFSQVLADIGDEQSLQQSLSTFSGHIRRISRILAALDESPSLVLLDEVGAGTDPSEGSALAIALLQSLADRAQLTVATTHFGELKALKYQDDRFENASVEFDEETLSPTYRLMWGIPGRSNALAIARRLGLDPDITDLAQTYVAPSASAEVNQVIAGLEDQRRQQETKAKEAADLVAQAERLNREITQKAELLREREQHLKLEQERAVQAAIAEAKGEIASTIRRLQHGTPTAQEAREATLAVDRLAEKYLPSRSNPPKPKPGFMPKVGDKVRIPSLGQTALVLSNPDKDGELSVRFGMMKMTVALAAIESLDGQKPDIPAAKSSLPPAAAAKATPLVQTSNNTVDIRGARVADAQLQLEEAIARAVPVGGALWIIHGKGTGKLRVGVHEFLQHSPHIDRYELAPQNEGGTGVTIAYLK